MVANGDRLAIQGWRSVACGLKSTLSKSKHRLPRNGHQRTGFILIELLMVIAIMGILASLMLPALGKARAKATGAACLTNLKQLQLCWQMYVDDHQGRVPPNRALVTNGVWRSTPDSWIGGSSATHDDDTRAIEEGLLFRYDDNRSVALYRCPADRSQTASRARRTRSYSMHGVLGGRTNEVQTVIQRVDGVVEPGRLFVFIDEHEDSIDDAHFLVWPYPDDRWVNLPAGRHGQAGVLSFADGHVEMWRWRAAKEFRPKVGYWKPARDPGDLEDLRRLQTCTLARSVGEERER
jgi:prepilin-type N-terminal cleavage/methylation domain-containing protein/prepilin-type processing-associated H-X9-DG protein